jgi:hypothetical protein
MHLAGFLLHIQCSGAVSVATGWWRTRLMRRIACSAAWGKHDSKCHQRVLQTGRTSRLGHRSMAGECSAAGHEQSHGHTLSPVWRIWWALLNRVVPIQVLIQLFQKISRFFSREQAGAAGLARSLQPSVVCYRIVCGCGQYGVRYGPRRRRSGCTAQAESRRYRDPADVEQRWEQATEVVGSGLDCPMSPSS